MHFTTDSQEETIAAGKQFAATLRGGDVVALRGDLGSGKTTFSKGIAAGLGIAKTVISPTFVLMKLYPVKKNNAGIRLLAHLDCYRLRDGTQLEAIGFSDYLNRDDVVTVIEWPEKVTEALPKKIVTVTFEPGEGDQRTIEVRR